MADMRDIHIHLTPQPGTTVHVTVTGDNVSVTSDNHRPNTKVASGAAASSGDVPETAIARLESSGASRNIREAVEGLRALGYELVPAEAKVSGKRPENYLRIIDPKYSATNGIGYLTPTYFGFSRASDRERLLGMPGHEPLTTMVKFSHVESAQPGLDVAKLLKS